MSESDEKESNLHYNFSLKHIPHNNNRPVSATSLLLPHTTLQSTSFTKIASTSSTPNAKSEQMKDKDTINAEANNETFVKDVSASIPKTFAYTLSLLDCSFTKRPMPGVWQLW